MATKIILVLDNVRSAHNVGTILRTADAVGVQNVWLCGLTPAPPLPGDHRPAYAQDRAGQQIAKTALGAEQVLELQYTERTELVIEQLHSAGYTITALEQSPNSTNLFNYQSPTKVALIVGHEVDGVDRSILTQVDTILEIPMKGTKESLNVAVATGIALYQLSH